ncbi:MAG: hypothetical protein ACOY3P_18105 [Planctomycetota bacterium]
MKVLLVEADDLRVWTQPDDLVVDEVLGTHDGTNVPLGLGQSTLYVSAGGGVERFPPNITAEELRKAVLLNE